ncbi:MAG: hypothetical protein SOZ00_02745 [Tidjanibacter sp.]|nr:hypothetical protein [Tidjanibacter sp.]
MNKRILYCCALIALVGCDPSNGGGTDTPNNGWVPTEVPETINSSNLFLVDFFSDLSSEGNYFKTHDYTVASTHIGEQAGKRPVAYFFDRADYTAGEAYECTKIAYAVKSHPFFAQIEASTETITKGTGIVTPYMVYPFDGFAHNGTFAAGVTLPAPLSKTTQLTLFTMRVEKSSQIEDLVACRADSLRSSGIVIGTIKPELKTAVTDYLKQKFDHYRLSFGDVDATPYDLFVLMPDDYVCRSVEPLKKVNLKYYRISIEKLFSAKPQTAE